MPARAIPLRPESDRGGQGRSRLLDQPRHRPGRQKGLAQPLRLGLFETPFQCQRLAAEQTGRRLIRESEQPLKPGPHLGLIRPGGKFAGKEDVVAQAAAASGTQLTCATGRIWVSQTPPTLTVLGLGVDWQPSPRSWIWHLSSRGLPSASQEGTLR